MYDALALHYLPQLSKRLQFTALDAAQQFDKFGRNLIGRRNLHALAVDRP
jgi:hypothetical protein